MEQGQASKRAWAMLKKCGYVDVAYKKVFVDLFQQLYAAGYEFARCENCNQKEVVKMDQWGKVVARYKSASEAARRNAVSKHMISRVCLGKNVTAKGYIYKYV